MPLGDGCLGRCPNVVFVPYWNADIAPQPGLQTIQIEVNDRRGVERQQLTQCQPANHSITEWLAQFRSGAVAERERDACHHRSRRRHHDRTEALQARLSDRVQRRQVLVALRDDSEIDQNDAVLLDDADQQDDGDDANH